MSRRNTSASIHRGSRSPIRPTMFDRTLSKRFTGYGDGRAFAARSTGDRQDRFGVFDAPWVRNVIGVRKLPGGTIDVRLEYRSPVAMVHVFKPDPNDRGSYFYPVDGEGVLLPITEFAQVGNTSNSSTSRSQTRIATAFGRITIWRRRVELRCRPWPRSLRPIESKRGFAASASSAIRVNRTVPQFEITRTGWLKVSLG